MIQEFSRMYNCHYQFGGHLMDISIDSQMNGFRGVFRESICTPHSLKEHDLVLCLFWLAVIFTWLLGRA